MRQEFCFSCQQTLSSKTLSAVVQHPIKSDRSSNCFATNRHKKLYCQTRVIQNSKLDGKTVKTLRFVMFSPLQGLGTEIQPEKHRMQHLQNTLNININLLFLIRFQRGYRPRNRWVMCLILCIYIGFLGHP